MGAMERLNTFLELWFHSLVNPPFLSVLFYQWSWSRIIDPDFLYFPQVSLQKRHHWMTTYKCVYKFFNEKKRMNELDYYRGPTKEIHLPFSLMSFWLRKDLFKTIRLSSKECQQNLRFPPLLLTFSEKKIIKMFIQPSNDSPMFSFLILARFHWNFIKFILHVGADYYLNDKWIMIVRKRGEKEANSYRL